MGEYIAIEVASGDYFLGMTLMEAATKARVAYPQRRFHFIKIGSAVVRRLRSCSTISVQKERDIGK